MLLCIYKYIPADVCVFNHVAITWLQERQHSLHLDYLKHNVLQFMCTQQCCWIFKANTSRFWSQDVSSRSFSCCGFDFLPANTLRSHQICIWRTRLLLAFPKWFLWMLLLCSQSESPTAEIVRSFSSKVRTYSFPGRVVFLIFTLKCYTILTLNFALTLKSRVIGNIPSNPKYLLLLFDFCTSHLSFLNGDKTFARRSVFSLHMFFTLSWTEAITLQQTPKNRCWKEMKAVKGKINQ